MKRGHLWLVAAAVCGSACARPALLPDPLVEGRESYERACAGCHGAKGRGDGPEARALSVRPADLTRLIERHDGRFPREYVMQVVTGERDVPGHARQMPTWRERFGGGDSPVEAAAAVYQHRRLELLTDYVASLQR